MPLKSIPFTSFLKGLNSSTTRTNQPQGTVPRLNNMVLTRRGGLVTCDGSQIVNAFNDIPIANRGRAMCEVLFSPTSVLPYYMRIMKALDIPLGPPLNLTLTTAGGGSLAAGNYFYKVTAIDNVGGETIASNEANIATGANGSNTLTWNIVPNAQGYNIYRGTASGGETLLSGAGLPVPQVGVGNLTASFIDTGASTSGAMNIVDAIHGVASPNVIWLMPNPINVNIGTQILVAGTGIVLPPTGTLDGLHIVTAVYSPTSFATANLLGVNSYGSIVGTVTVVSPPPAVDTTQQTGLYKMPSSIGGIAYNNSNLVALFPADVRPAPGVGGGGGGGGGTGSGTGGAGGPQNSTPSGGVPGNVSLIPQMVQFNNQIAIALGNTLPPQVYRDATGTVTNPANISGITAISVDANGVVTITAAHNLVASQTGGSIIVSGVPLGPYNGTFVTISVSPGTIKVYNHLAIGQAASAGGFVTITTTPIISTFTTAYPTWATGITYLVGDIVTPTVSNGHYYKCIQGGISGATQPTFPTVTGQQVTDATVIWQEAGLTNTTAPPPPGCGHFTVYSGSLWAWNTWYTNTTNGLDGPTALRMCDSGNINSWNPVNQAFIDKDDGSEGMGLGAFTITGFGIPPEGSLIAFKNYSGYQIVGVFGSSNFLIQRIKSDLGCTAPRTIQFLTGYGLIRFSHLGFTLFDGINDKVMSEDIKDFIFPTNDTDTLDITSIDFNWVSISWASQTVYPPMYVCAVPVGNSNGKLTEIVCFDLVLKCWAGIVTPPFAISTLYQARSTTTTAVTLMGTFDDGCLHRCFAGDSTWDNSIDTPGPSPVNWSVETPEVINKEAPESRFYCKQLSIRGKFYNPTSQLGDIGIVIQDEISYDDNPNVYPIGSTGLFVAILAINQSGISIHCDIEGSGPVEIDSFDYGIDPTDSVVPPRLT